ncbi:hypothetical protein BN873_150296 [Candidatus Competibacter denitrificans Run_A_D11]|uniref:Uncharacterized protein n=1 Tax=Candidatus Competibacter denitrificans Run_A_D11 TaxID=1400863 RepID=W6MBU1_9GAMM|nr:hypothetical protein BN873_150296 [Candidatus Competibacter denitrificans Run_A_D11]
MPSRKSELHQCGAWRMVCEGHCRSGNWTGGKGRYLWRISGDMISFSLLDVSGRVQKSEEPNAAPIRPPGAARPDDRNSVGAEREKKGRPVQATESIQGHVMQNGGRERDRTSGESSKTV